MKKIVAMILAVLMLAALAACGGVTEITYQQAVGTAATTAQTQTKPTTTQTQTQPAAPTQTQTQPAQTQPAAPTQTTTNAAAPATSGDMASGEAPAVPAA